MTGAIWGPVGSWRPIPCRWISRPRWRLQCLSPRLLRFPFSVVSAFGWLLAGCAGNGNRPEEHSGKGAGAGVGVPEWAGRKRVRDQRFPVQQVRGTLDGDALRRVAGYPEGELSVCQP